MGMTSALETLTAPPTVNAILAGMTMVTVGMVTRVAMLPLL